MSGPSGTGAPPSGVVQNSALTFVASAQPMQPTPELPSNAPGNLEDNSTAMGQADRLVPPGVKALCEACSRLYPEQPNPLQVTTRVKYWLGGQDPLDYISMYWNPGKPEENIPAHWHYISFGLSDLHGDGRVHPPPAGGPSGYGFELTLRLASEGGAPPLWPAALLQALARYVFTTGNKFCAGDHISWHRPLDGSMSRVRHLLVAADPQLPALRTPHGSLHMLQVVGCTSRELRAAQRGSGLEVLKAIGEDPKCGGRWLVTLARRGAAGGLPARAAPADLAGVSARLAWAPDETSPSLSAGVEEQIKQTLRRGLHTMSTDRPLTASADSRAAADSFEMSSMERALPEIPEAMQGSWRQESVEFLDSVHIVMNAEAASLLPLAVEGRLLHGRHFTWRDGDCALTVLPPAVSGALPTARSPIAARGLWLQVLLTKEEALELSSAARELSRSDSESDSEESAPQPPRTYALRRGARLTVVP